MLFFQGHFCAPECFASIAWWKKKNVADVGAEQCTVVDCHLFRCCVCDSHICVKFFYWSCLLGLNVFASMMWGTYLKSWSTLWRTPRPRATSCPWCSIYYWSVMITWPGSTHSHIHSHILLPKLAQIMLLFSGTCLLMFFCYENNLALCLMKYKTTPPPPKNDREIELLSLFSLPTKSMDFLPNI